MYQSFRPEQISHSFPWKQVDPGAEGLFHRNQLKDLHGKYVCDTVKPTHCLQVLQFDQVAARSSSRMEFWCQICSELCSSLSRKKAAQVIFIQWICSSAWCALKAHLIPGKVQHHGCTRSQWKTDFSLLHRSRTEKHMWPRLNSDPFP